MATSKEEKKHQYSEATLSLINFVVRPPRADFYSESELGFKTDKINGVPCIRDDFDVPNPKGLKMKCSFYHFNDKVKPFLWPLAADAKNEQLSKKS